MPKTLGTPENCIIYSDDFGRCPVKGCGTTAEDTGTMISFANPDPKRVACEGAAAILRQEADKRRQQRPN